MRKVLLVVPFLLSIMACSNLPKEYASFEDYPVYKGNDLEAVYAPEKTSFRFWSPAAKAVRLNIYEEGIGGQPIEVHELKYDKDGTWIASIKKDLKGRFYTFQIFMNGKWYSETPGIWAKAVGVNGNRGAIIDCRPLPRSHGSHSRAVSSSTSSRMPSMTARPSARPCRWAIPSRRSC